MCSQGLLPGQGIKGYGRSRVFRTLRLKSGLQPPEEMLRVQNDRHAVMDGGDHGVWFRGDDGEGLHDLPGCGAVVVQRQFAFARRSDSFIPDAGRAEETVGLHREPERLLATSGGLPLVKAVGGYQAALRRERAAEAGFLVDQFLGHCFPAVSWGAT